MGDLLIYFGLLDFLLLSFVALALAVLTGFLLSRWRNRREALQHIAGLLDTLSQGLLIVRADGRVVLANEEAQNVWGQARFPGHLPELLAPLVREVQQQQVAVVHSVDGPSGLKLQVRATELRPGWILLVMEDLTARRYRETFYRNFVSNVSHELKTPLTVIQGHVAAVGEGLAEDDPRQTPLRIVAQEAARLTQLVDNLLLLSRLEMPDFTLERRPVNLEAVVEDAILQMSDLAEERDVSLNLQRSGRLPRVQADQARLKQVLINLLDNGIKYNRESGSVTVCLEACEEHAIVRVRDTGEGIPAQDLPHIFEKMYRAGRRGRYVEGSGLGLSIVQRIVEQHGGAISVESRPGAGTTFTVTLPYVPD